MSSNNKLKRSGSGVGLKRVGSGLGLMAMVASLSVAPATEALAMSNRRAPATGLQASPVASVPTALQPPLVRTGELVDNPLHYYENEDEYDLNFDVRKELNSVKKLQKSTGSEILDEELQQQVDEAVTSPDQFLDAHVEDASLMEKMAMASIPQQLPRPALDVLNTKKAIHSLDSSTERVTHEEELELGRLVQRGVKIHKLKADFEEKEQREISRQEWANLTRLSTKELRQQISAYRQAKQLLVSSNMGLVHAVVRKQYRDVSKVTGISFEELIQEGSIGLMRAAELFDPSRGLRFSTYATIWIKGALQNSHIADGTVTLPIRERNKWNKIVKAQEDLTKFNGSEPSIEEIAHHLNMKVSEVVSTQRKMTQMKKMMSLDYQYKNQKLRGTDTTVNTLENDKGLMEDADMAEKSQLKADVVAALASNLDAREARLMRLRYGLADGQTRSISQCAEAMGLSQTRVQQLASKCLKKLREAAEAESLEEYLLTIA